ncbi:hypothetical protein CH063_06314 [Colletotrichum higginsianum]|uniref:Uncharacterized protein n=1 Tax=Colletotrichum higginsianum (strain IMI 349063) TaxID=759273 RepID=H1V236_COLHI|nr:hypothetical protein CH063_06314 [Colletotrichum higginsianum]
MDEQGLGTLLPETEGGDRAGLDDAALAVAHLNGHAGEEELLVPFQLRLDVVRVRVPRHQPGIHHLQAPVDHPRAGGPLAVARQPFLRHAREQVARETAQLRHLLLDDGCLVDVVGHRRRPVKRSNTDIVDAQAPCCQGPAKRRDSRVCFPEVVAEGVYDVFPLPTSLLVQNSESFVPVGSLVRLLP